MIRQTRPSPLGQTIAEYKGTSDRSDCWQNAGDTNIDNMCLTARHFYGTGVNNIHQLVLSRRFRNKVTCSNTDFLSRGDALMPSNTTGWEEAYGYDRRNRRSVVEVYGEPIEGSTSAGGVRPAPDDNAGTGGEALVALTSASKLLRADYTWYDHQDRVRFRATFAPDRAQTLRSKTGRADADNVNPRTRDVYLFGDPTAAMILAESPARLTETIYNNRGQIEVEREYDVQNSSGAGSGKFTATRTYFDHGGRVLVRISPSGMWERNTYDALGRQVASSTMRGDIVGAPLPNTYEVERTATGYSVFGHPERTSRFIRTIVDANGKLEVGTASANAVRTDTITWFDKSGRPVATASIGSGFVTGSGAFTSDVFFSPSSDLPALPSVSGSPFENPPTWGATGWSHANLPAHAQVTTTEYDDSGRVSASRAPNGSLTRKFYDNLNRVVLERIVPVAGGDPIETAYQYKNGKLSKIAAVRPGHTAESDLVNFDAPPSDTTIQVTELVYGDGSSNSARIIDPASPNESISADYDLLIGVKFPSGGCDCLRSVGSPPADVLVADFDLNSVIDAQDIFAFLNAWFASSPSANVNGDTVVDTSDIFFFLNCWFNGASCAHSWNTLANGGLDIRFEYTLDGLVHSRADLAHTDLPGNPVSKIAFDYDHLGRRIGTRVVSGGVDVADAIERLTYRYDTLDRLTSATAEARDRPTNCYYTVATNIFTHDSFGNLKTEQLAHGGASPANVAALHYEWEYAVGALDPPTGPSVSPIVPRLKHMIFPWAAGSDGLDSAHRRAISINYGGAYAAGTPATWLDNALHRPRSIGTSVGVSATTSIPANAATPIINYSYAGASMRTGMIMGPSATQPTEHAVVQSFADPLGGPGLSGLDRFGRTQNLSYTRGGSSQSLQAGRQYQYDRFGNIAGVLVSQRPTNSGTDSGGASLRSMLFSYDGHNRLTKASVGKLIATPSPAEWTIAADHDRAEHNWRLDDLGNWRGTINSGTTSLADAFAAHAGGRSTAFFPAGALPNEPSHHVGVFHRTDQRNQVSSAVDSRTFADGSDPQATEVAWAYDPTGRIRYDGRLLYEHDAFGRLVQVRRAAGVRVGITGTIVSIDEIGHLVAHYSYDALGRLIRVQRPESEAGSPATGGSLAITDLYSDGVRVVQEVGWTGVPMRGLPNSEKPGLPRRAFEVHGDGRTQGACTLAALDSSVWTWHTRRLQREYVWAMDPSAYVDECAAQFVYTQANTRNATQTQELGDDTTATVLYALTDHNANLIALTDSQGHVAAQYSYTVYGEPLHGPNGLGGAEYAGTAQGATTFGSLASAEAVLAARGNRVGHQGLRAERFDRPWDPPLDPSSASAAGTSTTGAYRVVYHNRNRIYEPAEGRFLSQDPNGLGLPVLGSMAQGGVAIDALDIAPDVQSHFGDGMGTHTSYAGQPHSRRDATGLVLGDIIQGVYTDLMAEYIGRLEFAVDWALDLDLEDSWNPFFNDWVQGLLFESTVRNTIEALQNDDGPPSPADAILLASGGSGRPAMTPGSRLALARGHQTHHIATNKGSRAASFKSIFTQAGMTLEDPDNKVRIAHGGRHPRGYHDWVEKRLSDAVSNLSGKEAEKKLRSELKKIKSFLSNGNADFINDTVGGMPTRDRGFRHLVDTEVLDAASGRRIRRR